MNCAQKCETVEEEGARKKKKTGKSPTSSIWQKEQGLVETILCTMAQLWHSVRTQGEMDASLIQIFSDEGLQTLLQAFPSELAHVAILTIATHLPPSCTPALSDNTIPRLQKLGEMVNGYCCLFVKVCKTHFQCTNQNVCYIHY